MGDCARAIVMAVERYDSSEPVNIGTGREIKICALAEKIRRLSGFKGKIIWDKSKPNGQPRRCLNVDRARKEFGFSASISFDQGLQETWDWFIASGIGRA